MHEHQGLDECLILLKLWLKRRALPGMHACVFACMCVKLCSGGGRCHQGTGAWCVSLIVL